MKNIIPIGYVCISLLFTIFSYLFIDANFIYLKSLYSGINTYSRELSTFTYIFLISTFFLLYIHLVKYYEFINKEKFKIFFIVLIIIFLSYPAMLSYDIFNYLATSKVAFFYHENPYIIMPIEFSQDSLLQFTRATNKIALYGPGWILLSGIPYLLSFGNYIFSIYLLKSFVGIFYIGTLFLIWKITRKLLPVIIFAASPLILIETFISGHNDVVMMFFMLLSFYFLRNKKILLSFLSLLASILIKYSTILLIPVFIYVVIKVIKNEKIDWEKIYSYCFFLMVAIFLLSVFREEIYPWYAIWPFSILVLLPFRKNIFYLSTALTFGLMLSYVPFMYNGSYFGISHFLRFLSIFSPPLLFIIYLFFKNNIRFFNKLI